MKRQVILFLYLLLIILIAIIIGLVMYNNNKYAFVKPEFETNVTQEELYVPEELQYAKINVAEGYKVYICGNLTIDKVGKLPIYFKSDKDNKVYIKFRISDEKGKLLIESGLIKPGETIKDIKISQVNQEMNINIKIMSYDPNTYYSMGVANLNSKIKIMQ